MSALSSHLVLDPVDVIDGVDVPEPATDASRVDAMNHANPYGPLHDLSERELIAELVLIEEQIRERAPSDDRWRGEPGAEMELLELFLRERAVRRHLHAERAVTSAALRHG